LSLLEYILLTGTFYHRGTLMSNFLLGNCGYHRYYNCF